MNDMVLGPDGSLYIAYPFAQVVRRVAPNGSNTIVAGNGSACGHPTLLCGDGGLATAAQLREPQGLAIGADGSLYIADSNDGRIRRVGTKGIITTIAGNGTVNFSGDGGLATQAGLLRPTRLAMAPDGALYVASYDQLASSANRVRRIGQDGIITPFAGNGTYCPSFPISPCGDGGFATEAELGNISGMAVAPDGSLYITDDRLLRVRRIGPDGKIATVAGTGAACTTPELCGDGGPATLAQFSQPQDVAVGRDGSVYIIEAGAHPRIRMVDSSGVITSVAGNGMPSGPIGDGGPAAAATIANPISLAVGPTSLYIAHVPIFPGDNRMREVAPALPGLQPGETSVAAEDGSELYIFTSTGRHLRTLEALTGAMRHQFAYDNAGQLISVTDGDGKVTQIERDSAGNSTAIVAPGGQRTTLAVNGDGYLSRVTNPAGEAVQMTYNTDGADGLLATLTDPRGNVHHFLYDDLGRLIRDDNPAGGVTTLARTDITDDHYSVTLTTALGLVTTYEVEKLSTGDTRRVHIDPSGARTESLIRTDGSRRVTYPDSTVVDLVEGPDPRFGMQAPILKTLAVTTPGGITTSRSATRTATLLDPNNLLSLTSQTDTVTVNGQIYTRTYTADTGKVTTTTPEGRQSVATLDALGRVVEHQADVSFGLEPTHYGYDNRGRLTQLQQDTQFWIFDYDVQNRLSARTDAAGSSTDYLYDAADRPTQFILPSMRSYGLAYDSNGNRTEVTMPDLGVHLLDYTPIDQEAGYGPPGNSSYVTRYDTDGRVNHVTLPSGRTETYSYDSGNRPAGLSYPEAAVALAYAAGDASQRVGRLTRTPTGGGSAQEIVFTYNSDLVIGTTWSGAATGQYTYAYDSNFLLKSIALNSVADAITTMFTRDKDGLLTGLGPFNFIRQGPAGDPSQIDDGTLVITLAYDSLGRIENRTLTVDSQQKYIVQFTYDTVGRIARKVETIAGAARTYDYTYDADSQLSEVRREGVIVEHYTYDANRNRLSRQVGGNPASTASYDSQDRLLQQGAVLYQFNSDGYLIQGGNDTFQYSTTGELLQATVGGQTVTYAYDGLRRRVSRTDAVGTTQYLYGNPDDALQVSNTRDPAGVLTTYYYDDGRRLFALQRGSTRYYVATDQLGSPRVITDPAGALVKVVEYDSFGNITLDSNPGFELSIGFAGGVADGTTGLVRFGLRDYDPIAGRWTARDPAVFTSDQANLYAYVNNNPVNLVDPVGFGSAGVGLCQGVCVGVKIGYVPGVGISACFEAGFGVGNSVELDPFADLADNGLSTEAKLGLKYGIGKVEGGFEVPADPCGNPLQPKWKAEACIGPLCANTSPSAKGKLSLDETGKIKNPFRGGGLGVTGKLAGKICQQAKW